MHLRPLIYCFQLQKHARKLEECIADATRDLEEAGMLNLVNGGLALSSMDFSDSPGTCRDTCISTHRRLFLM